MCDLERTALPSPSPPSQPSSPPPSHNSLSYTPHVSDNCGKTAIDTHLQSHSPLPVSLPARPVYQHYPRASAHKIRTMKT